MDEFELLHLRKNPQLLATLKVYSDLHANLREQIENFDGWISRVTEVPDIESSELPTIHGRLIAFGLLKFDVSGRDTGLKYQLTPQGKQALAGPSSPDEDHESESCHAA